ncbi:uncharacterized protein LOC127565881 [Drosophila albomicans]|uniref:Uncharacterized protein LOC127565881 n=1 Tax=Drosophila albomicans TaxID=7291 RepID=A0A9C6T0K7_DROAB|nr:uncharacterized protein LOC127565881 [Drosophila albomicans]
MVDGSKAVKDMSRTASLCMQWNESIKNWNNVSVRMFLANQAWRRGSYRRSLTMHAAPPMTRQFLCRVGDLGPKGSGVAVDIVSHSFANLRSTNGNNECIL